MSRPKHMRDSKVKKVIIGLVLASAVALTAACASAGSGNPALREPDPDTGALPGYYSPLSYPSRDVTTVLEGSMPDVLAYERAIWEELRDIHEILAER